MGGKWEFLALRIVGHQTDAGEKGSVFSQSAPLLLTLITACLFWSPIPAALFTFSTTFSTYIAFTV